MRSTTPTQIATSFGLSEQELFRQGLVSFLHERKRQVLHLKLETLARYGCRTLAQLEDKIAQGTVQEHPAWEDLIVAENLESRREEINDYLLDLQQTADYSAN